MRLLALDMTPRVDLYGDLSILPVWFDIMAHYILGKYRPTLKKKLFPSSFRQEKIVSGARSFVFVRVCVTRRGWLPSVPLMALD